MSKIHTTLHKKGDSTVEIYPNVESENIPNNAITTDKITDASVTTAKINDGAVTTAKIASNSVTSGKLASNAVTTAKINDGAVTTSKIENLSINENKIQDNSISTVKLKNGAVTYDKLASDVKLLFDKINRTFNLFVGVGGSPMYFGNTTLSSLWNNYSDEDINDALDFDKLQGEYSNTNLDIIAIIIDGLYNPNNIRGDYEYATYGNVDITIRKTSSTNYQIYYNENNTREFEMEFDLSTHTITSYSNNKIINLTLKKAINFDVL
jgi:hypothetical protein